MVYQLKLLLAVLIAGSFFAVLSRPALSALLGEREQRRAWLVLLVGTVITFMARLPTLFLLGVAGTAWFAMRSFGGDMKARLAAFMMLLLIFPPIVVWVEGFGDINRILSLDPMRVLVLVLLTPASVQLFFRRRERKTNPFLAVDICIIGYVMLGFFLSMHASFTYLLRFLVESSIATVIPYYAFTRGLKSVEDLRFVGTYALVACVFVAAVAVGETALQRNLYQPLQYIYGAVWQSGGSLMRGGLVRVQSTTPHPIMLAFVLIFAIGLWFWLLAPRGRRASALVVLAAFVGALVSTWSRGPWLGAMLFALSMLALRWLSARTFALALIALIALGVGIKSSGADEALLDALKFAFGSSQEDFATIAYRKELLDTALALIKQSPFLGVPNYMDYMQDLRQGQGIIDLVNNYLVVSLNTGLIGMALYLFPQVIVIGRLLMRFERFAAAGRSSRFIKVVISVLLGADLTLFTTAALNVLPYLMIFLQAAALAYLAADESPAEDEAAAPLPIRRRVPLYSVPN